jgi:hypothetical protein|tara:strand:- start:387 stop:596 length:210 start_codon:yes stop_codon:yes gene_type:complete
VNDPLPFASEYYGVLSYVPIGFENEMFEISERIEKGSKYIGRNYGRSSTTSTDFSASSGRVGNLLNNWN